MKFIHIDGRLINLEHVVTFQFIEETYSESSKCEIFYDDGRTDKFSYPSIAFEKLISRLDNFHLMV